MHISDNWCNVEARYSLLHLNWIPVLIWTAKIWTVITNPNIAGEFHCPDSDCPDIVLIPSKTAYNFSRMGMVEVGTG